MKIAMPIENGQIGDHFGHCEYFTIYTIHDQAITDKVTLPAPSGCGCKAGIIDTLSQMGVTVMLAGNMGAKPWHKLTTAGIEVVRGCQGMPDAVIQDYLAGNISDAPGDCAEKQGCPHHRHEHD